MPLAQLLRPRQIHIIINLGSYALVFAISQLLYYRVLRTVRNLKEAFKLFHGLIAIVRQSPLDTQ